MKLYEEIQDGQHLANELIEFIKMKMLNLHSETAKDAFRKEFKCQLNKSKIIDGLISN